ncbi:DUF2637 domain-containing protein [Krasilnikovia sp. MM14-A1259]|uniref:DUF2637 domain-containing protein n=1 Tax=Krasilnikovia sp. MM14-A1259 TaxID=3373539 RepID=UPI00399D3159
MNPVTFTSRATTAVVAGVAGFSSYRHIVEVAQRAGEHHAVAAVLPLSIDGLILVGTMAMVEDKRAGRRPRLSARVALGFGVVATLAANIASAQPHLTARLVAAVPAVAFLITVEVLARAGRTREVQRPAGESQPVIDESARPVEAVPVAVAPVSAPPAPVAPDFSVAVEVDDMPGQEVRPDDRESQNIDLLVRAIKSTNPNMPIRQVARLVQVSDTTVRRSLRRTAPADESQKEETHINGHKPDLEVPA